MHRSLPSILLAVLAFTACSDSVTSVSEGGQASAAPDQTASPAATLVDRGTGVFNQNWTGTIDCAGEDIQFVYQIPYTWQLTTTPTGTYYKVHFVDKGSTGLATGQTSGRNWTLDQGALTEIDADRDGLFIHYHGMGIWRSDNGPTIQNYELWKFRVDASGNVVLDDFTLRFTCRDA